MILAEKSFLNKAVQKDCGKNSLERDVKEQWP
jgi:hypothetical protein